MLGDTREEFAAGEFNRQQATPPMVPCVYRKRLSVRLEAPSKRAGLLCERLGKPSEHGGRLLPQPGAPSAHGGHRCRVRHHRRALEMEAVGLGAPSTIS